MFSSNVLIEDFVLSSLRASPFAKPFFTTGGLHDVKNVYWNVSVGLNCVLISNLERGDNICCCEFFNSNTCMLILVNRAEEKLSVHREIAKFLTVYRVCYTPIETLRQEPTGLLSFVISVSNSVKSLVV